MTGIINLRCQYICTISLLLHWTFGYIYFCICILLLIIPKCRLCDHIRCRKPTFSFSTAKCQSAMIGYWSWPDLIIDQLDFLPDCPLFSSQKHFYWKDILKRRLMLWNLRFGSFFNMALFYWNRLKFIFETYLAYFFKSWLKKSCHKIIGIKISNYYNSLYFGKLLIQGEECQH